MVKGGGADNSGMETSLTSTTATTATGGYRNYDEEKIIEMTTSKESRIHQ